MAKEHEAVWWVLGGILVLGLARSAQVAQVNAAAGTAPAAAGGFFGGILSSLGLGGAAIASSLPASGLQPINYNPVTYPSVAANPYSNPSPYVPATPTPGGGFNNLAAPSYGANPSAGVLQYLI